MTTSRSPTTVMTANGEVQTREEATENVKQLDLLVKVVLLEETPAVLSLGKLCEDHGYTYHWTSGQKPHLIRNGKRIWLMIVLQQSLGETRAGKSRPPHELPMEPRAKVEPDSGKHSVFTHFPKDPNCDIFLKTKITKASRAQSGTFW